MGVTRRPLPLNSMKVDHALAVVDCYLELYHTGKLNYFVYEPKDDFKSAGRSRVYAPDAFFIYGRKAYLLETQLSPLSTKRWGEKWAVASDYFNEGHYKQSSWQVVKGVNLWPRLVVLTKQNPEIVSSLTHLRLSIGENLKDLLD